MGSYKIRFSQEQDFDRIFDIWLQNQNQATGIALDASATTPLTEHFRQLFSHPRSTFYVAELESGEIVGWQGLLPLLANPVVGQYIAQSSTYVDKRYFNQDIGAQLIGFAFRDAKRLGIDHIYGWVKADNDAVNKIAASFGCSKHVIPQGESKHLPDFNLYVYEVK